MAERDFQVYGLGQGCMDYIGKVAAYPAPDTTGCGDVFHAGFIYGLLKGWGVEKCLDFAAWAGAMVSLELGGRAGIPTVEDYGLRE